MSHLEGAVGGHLSETGGESSSARESLSLTDVTPVLTKREANAGVGAEESSDDEMGSVMMTFLKAFNKYDSCCFSRSKFRVAAARRTVEPRPPFQRHLQEFSHRIRCLSTLWASTGRQRPNLTLTRKITLHYAKSSWFYNSLYYIRSDDEDDVSDHDLTPCNPSPNMSQLMGWSEGRIADKNEIEEGWRNHVQTVIEKANNVTILVTFVGFGKLFDDLKSKTCVITQDSAVELSKEKVAFSQDLVKTTTEQLQNLTDILSEDIPYPHVWYDFENAGGARLIERIKFTILEIQENLDNYVDKKDFALECLDAMKAHQKLVSLGEQMSDYNMESEPMDLCRVLYKLHFQLLLLLESFGKLLRLISASHQDLTSDKSRELGLIQTELKKAFKIPMEIELNTKDQQHQDEKQHQPEEEQKEPSDCTQTDQPVGEDRAQQKAEDEVETVSQEAANLDVPSSENKRSPSPGGKFRWLFLK